MNYLFASLLLLAPLYVWRFPILGLPTNFLMVIVAVVIAVGLINILNKNQSESFIFSLKKIPRLLIWGAGLLLLASVVGLVVNGFTFAKFAQWVVLFIEPMLIAVLVNFYLKTDEQKQVLIKSLYIFIGLSGILALLQYFLLIALPASWWGNSDEPKRAIAFFIHPNNFALFVTPLLAYIIPSVIEKLQSLVKKVWQIDLFWVLLWGLGAIGLFLSLSRGGWLALLAAMVVYVIVKANKKLILGFITVVVVLGVIVAAVPNLRYRVILPFYGEKSSVARISLWETGWKMIKDKPITGQGVNGFNYQWDSFNTDPGLDHYNFPHNIILNFWSDYGLIGLFGFLMILAWGLWYGWKNRQSTQALALLLFLIAVIIHGLIDIPYLKNDLALVFWIVIGLHIAHKQA